MLFNETPLSMANLTLELADVVRCAIQEPADVETTVFTDFAVITGQVSIADDLNLLVGVKGATVKPYAGGPCYLADELFVLTTTVRAIAKGRVSPMG